MEGIWPTSRMAGFTGSSACQSWLWQVCHRKVLPHSESHVHHGSDGTIGIVFWLILGSWFARCPVFIPYVSSECIFWMFWDLIVRVGIEDMKT
jgi:hypothetical protein